MDTISCGGCTKSANSAVPLQVMEGLYHCLHRAELGGEAERCPDPQLPVRVRLPAAAPRDDGPRTPPAAAAPAAPARAGPRSVVQKLFGLDVQVRSSRTSPKQAPSTVSMLRRAACEALCRMACAACRRICVSALLRAPVSRRCSPIGRKLAQVTRVSGRGGACHEGTSGTNLPRCPSRETLSSQYIGRGVTSLPCHAPGSTGGRRPPAEAARGGRGRGRGRDEARARARLGGRGALAGDAGALQQHGQPARRRGSGRRRSAGGATAAARGGRRGGRAVYEVFSPGARRGAPPRLLQSRTVASDWGTREQLSSQSPNTKLALCDQ